MNEPATMRDLDIVIRWASVHRYTLRFTFHPYDGHDCACVDCLNGVWDLTVKPGRDEDHTHFTSCALTAVLAQLATTYGLPKAGFSLAVRKEHAWDRQIAGGEASS